MNKEVLTEYFETYVANYPPYKDNEVYRILIRYLVDYYYDRVYNIEPKVFKDLFEKSTIPVEIYDNILISVGFSKELLTKINFSSKIILLKTFTDFERYKSSLLFFQNIVKSFQDKLNIYELFIDYDNVDGWILRPKVVYENENVVPFTGFLQYDEVYTQIPTLLLTSEELTRSLDNEEICLPIKSNLLYLSYDLSTNVSLLSDLLATIFVKTYCETTVVLYFSDFNYSLSLSKIIFLWYYLLTKYFDTTWTAVPLNQLIVFNSDMIPYTVTDIPNILQDYDDINSRKELNDFYLQYLNPLVTYNVNPNEYTHTDFFNILASSENLLMNYIDNRISSAQNQKMELISIMNEIYNSLLISISTSPDIDFQTYSNYYLYLLTQLSVVPKDTDTYIILSELKPFHTELVTDSITSIFIQDKFNQVYIDVTTYFEGYSTIVSLVAVCDVHSTVNEQSFSDSEPILSSVYFSGYFDNEDSLSLTDSFIVV